MPRNGTGTFERTNGNFQGSSVWQDQAASADAVIRAPQHDTHDQDIAQALTDSLAKDGQTTATGDLNLGNNKITNLAEGTNEFDCATVGQVGGEIRASVNLSASGFTFSNIPSWAKECILTLRGVETNGSNGILIQIGDSSGLETSGYLGTEGIQSDSLQNYELLSGSFAFTANWTTSVRVSGSVYLTLQDEANDRWVANGMLGNSATASMHFMAGQNNTMSNRLTQIFFDARGGDDFQFGQIGLIIR